MSVDVWREVWKLPLQRTDRLVLLAIADGTNKFGNCWLGVASLAKMTSLSDRSIQRCVARLQKAGYLQVIPRSGHSNLYRVMTPDRLSPTPDRLSPPPPAECHPTPDSASPISISDPLFDPSKIRRGRKRYSETAEIRELNARAAILGYRAIERLEQPAAFRQALEQFEREQSAATLDGLRQALAARRSS